MVRYYSILTLALLVCSVAGSQTSTPTATSTPTPTWTPWTANTARPTPTSRIYDAVGVLPGRSGFKVMSNASDILRATGDIRTESSLLGQIVQSTTGDLVLKPATVAEDDNSILLQDGDGNTYAEVDHAAQSFNVFQPLIADDDVTLGNAASDTIDVNGILFGAVLRERFTFDGTITGAANQYLNFETGLASSATIGMIPDRAGSIIGISWMSNGNAANAAGLSLDVRVNNAVVYSLEMADATDKNSTTQAKGTDTFVADDEIQMSITADGAGDIVTDVVAWVTYTRD